MNKSIKRDKKKTISVKSFFNKLKKENGFTGGPKDLVTNFDNLLLDEYEQEIEDSIKDGDYFNVSEKEVEEFAQTAKKKRLLLKKKLRY